MSPESHSSPFKTDTLLLVATISRKGTWNPHARRTYSSTHRKRTAWRLEFNEIYISADQHFDYKGDDYKNWTLWLHGWHPDAEIVVLAFMCSKRGSTYNLRCHQRLLGPSFSWALKETPRLSHGRIECGGLIHENFMMMYPQMVNMAYKDHKWMVVQHLNVPDTLSYTQSTIIPWCV